MSDFDAELAQIGTTNPTDVVNQYASYCGVNGNDCGTQVTKIMNAALQSAGYDKMLPSNNLGTGIPGFLSQNYNVPLFTKNNLTLDLFQQLGPGTTIAMTRKPGDKNYEYGKTHAEVTAINPENGQLMVASKSSGKGILWKRLDQNYINSLPDKTTAANPFAQLEKKANAIAASEQSDFDKELGAIDTSFGDELNAINVPQNQPQIPESFPLERKLAQGVTGAMAAKIPIIDMSTGQILALGVGGTVGGMFAGPPGAAIGAGLMYGAEKQAENVYNQTPAKTLPEAAGQATQDVLGGTAMEAGAKIAEPFVAPVTKWIGAKLQGFGKSLYEKALKVPPSVPNEIREKARDYALKEGYDITLKSLKKLQDEKIPNFINTVDEIINQATTEGKMVDVRQVTEAFKRVRDIYKDEVNPGPILDAIDKAEQQLWAKAKQSNLGVVAPQNYEIPVAEAQAIKERLHVKLKKHYGEMSSVEQEINKDIARGLRLELEKQIPELADVNKEFGNALSLEAILERAVNRTRNYELVRLGDMVLATGGAAATGTIEGGLKTAIINHVLNNPKVISKIAILLNKSDSLTGKYIAKLLGYGVTKNKMEQNQ